MDNFIKSHFTDEKFEKILFYLEEQGFYSLRDLDNFDFDNLMFIPGIDQAVIKEFKSKIFKIRKPNEVPETSENIKIGTIDESQSNETNQMRWTYPKSESILNLPLSIRVRQALMRSKIYTLEDLLYKTTEQLFKVKNLGTKSFEEINHFLKNLVITEDGNSDILDDYNAQIGPSDKSNLTNIFPSNLSKRNNRPIHELRLPKRIIDKLTKVGVITIKDLIAFDNDDLFNEIKFDSKEMHILRNNLNALELDLLKDDSIITFEDIANENKPVPLELVDRLVFSKQSIALLTKEGYKTLGDLVGKKFSGVDYFFLERLERQFVIPVSSQFISKLNQADDRNLNILLRRAEGLTYEEIGSEFSMTRERVRQILHFQYANLKTLTELTAGVLFSIKGVMFTYSDLEGFFHSIEGAIICKLVLREFSTNYVHYIKYSDKFVKQAESGNKVEFRLSKYATEVIGDGINYYDNLEVIEKELEFRNLAFLDPLEDVLDYLYYEGYRLFGNYLNKGTRNYPLLCFEIIGKYFESGIKLGNKDDIEDLIRLRNLFVEHYPGFPLPENNRTLSAGLTRNPFPLILCNRGKYCLIEKVAYNMNVFNEIYNYLIDSPASSFHYFEVFNEFKGRLLAESDIDNQYFLHGMLKYLYQDEFDFRNKDKFSKKGAVLQNIDARINDILLNATEPVSKEEIKKQISGIKDYSIEQSIDRHPEFIRWDTNEFLHINNLAILPEDKETIFNTISQLTARNSGYSSDKLLYKTIEKDFPDLVERSGITNANILFNVSAYLFSSEFKFSRPHIITNDFPITIISSNNIGKALYQSKEKLSYNEFINLANKFQWANGSRTSIFLAIEKDYMRISEDEYVQKHSFHVSKSFLESISKNLDHLVSKTGYYAMHAWIDFENFPSSKIEWNPYFLESLINEFVKDFKILYPQSRNRIIQRGIIVPANSPHQTFEDLVKSALIGTGINHYTVSKLSEHLRLAGLTNTYSIPVELYSCDWLKYDKNAETFNLITN